MESPIDAAFNWLVLILSTIAGTLVGIPESQTVKMVFARVLIPPLLVLVGIWLWSYLAEKTEYKVILKSYAWFHASFLFLFDIFLFVFIVSPDIGRAISRLFAPLLLFGFFLLPFIVYALAIRPKYKSTYKDSRVLGSLPLLGLLYVLALLTYGLTVSIVGQADIYDLYKLIYGS